MKSYLVECIEIEINLLDICEKTTIYSYDVEFGRGQVVRQRVLALLFGGSNPSARNNYSILVFFQRNKMNRKLFYKENLSNNR